MRAKVGAWEEGALSVISDPETGRTAKVGTDVTRGRIVSPAGELALQLQALPGAQVQAWASFVGMAESGRVGEAGFEMAYFEALMSSKKNLISDSLIANKAANRRWRPMGT
jgi:hypothetical protein